MQRGVLGVRRRHVHRVRLGAIQVDGWQGAVLGLSGAPLPAGHREDGRVRLQVLRSELVVACGKRAAGELPVCAWVHGAKRWLVHGVLPGHVQAGEGAEGLHAVSERDVLVRTRPDVGEQLRDVS